MHKIINNFLFILPIIGMIAGLSLGVSIPLLSIMILFYVQKNLRFDYKNLKLDLVFFIYLLISIFWSMNQTKSAISFVSVFSIYLLFTILVQNIETINERIKISEKTLFYSMLAAIGVFTCELITDGLFSSFFRATIQNKQNYEFYLHYLDRGCAFITLFTWVVIAALINIRQYKLCLITYIITLTCLSLSDSFAGYLSFLISGIVFIITLLTPFKNSKILSGVLIFCTLIFVVLTFKIDPLKTSNEADFLPISAKHRLFIWSYSADKISEKPIFGWGHGASRLFDIKNDEMIKYQGHILHPLPTHPHNNIIQILLENGLIGLTLYLALIIKYLILWDQTTCSNDNFKRNNINNKLFKSAGYALFGSFFLISMISFNMWQSWWLCSYLWCGFMLKYFIQRKIDK